MHELGLCSSIVDAIERRAGERPVARVRVHVGRLHHVHPEAFEQSFAVAAMGTVAEDAAAELVLLPVRARCGDCGGSVGRRRDPAGVPDVRCRRGRAGRRRRADARVDRVPGLTGEPRCASRSPGQVVELLASHEHLARVDVSGVGRIINIGLLEDEALQPGDWVLIHVGFAMSKIDEEEAALALASLQLMGQAYDDELEAFWSSKITTDAATNAGVE